MADEEPKPKKLTGKRSAFVAAFVGEARGNATQAARIAGYAHPGQEGHRLLKIAEIADAVRSDLAQLRREGIAIRQVRVDNLVRRSWLMERVVEARAARYGAMAGEDPETAAAQAAKAVVGGDVPFEATTGLLVEKESVNNNGYRAVEWSVDVGLLKEMREHEKQVAQELGEWVEKSEIETPGPVLVRIVGVDAEQL